MDIVFETVTDSALGTPPQIQEFSNGWRARETWRANSADWRKVSLTPNRPRKGDKYGPGHPNLRVVDVTFRYHAGRDSADGTRRGSVLVDIVWETPGLNGRLPPPNPGLRFTRVRPGTMSQTVFGEINPDGTPVDPSVQIRGAYGVEKAFGFAVFEVYRYEHQQTFDPNVFMQQALFLHADTRVNDDDVLLPPLIGSGDQILLKKGQAKFANWRMDDNQGVIEIVMEIESGLDHLVRWQKENAAGELVGGVIESRIHPDGDFGGLW